MRQLIPASSRAGEPPLRARDEVIRGLALIIYEILLHVRPEHFKERRVSIDVLRHHGSDLRAKLDQTCLPHQWLAAYARGRSTFPDSIASADSSGVAEHILLQLSHLCGPAVWNLRRILANLAYAWLFWGGDPCRAMTHINHKREMSVRFR